VINDESVAMEVQSLVVDQTNTVKKVGDHTHLYLHKELLRLETPLIDVVVPVESIRAISERFLNTAYGFFLGKQVAYPVVANYVRNTRGKFGLVKSMLNSSTGLFSFQFSSIDGLNSMLENGPWFIHNHPIILCKWNLDVDLLKEDVGNALVWVKLHGVPVRAFSEDGLSVIATKLGVAKNLKKLIQTSRGVPVGPKVGFKPHKEYRPVPKKPTASLSGNKKKGVAHINEVSNSNPFDVLFLGKDPFDVLNSVDNNVELGTNRRTINLVNNEANSSGSCFMNVKNISTSNTHVIDKIGKFEDLLIDGPAILVDEAGNPLKKVECSGDYDSEDEVASVDNDMGRSLASERVGFGTQSLLEQ
ncbi:retrotransposon protein, putative, unclassified, partial [Tanacetum coccineum]